MLKDKRVDVATPDASCGRLPALAKGTGRKTIGERWARAALNSTPRSPRFPGRTVSHSISYPMPLGSSSVSD